VRWTLAPGMLLVPLLAACLDWSEDLLRPDGPQACPSQCTNNCAGGVCRLTCSGPGSGDCVCPAGMNCEVSCHTVGSCSRRIDCTNAVQCSVTCDGVGSCRGGVDCSGDAKCTVKCIDRDACEGSIVCGAGFCSVDCSGQAACAGGVDCSASCGCSVTDAPLGKLTCPSACAACTPADGCNNCP
jgi:hypothetical protein